MLLILLAAAAHLSCGPALRPVSADTTPTIVVDTIPPDTFTISRDSLEVLYSPGHVVYSHRRLAGPYPRALLMVGFHRGATVAERVRGIELSGGRLIGGGGLFYMIVVEDDGTADPLWQAIDRLRALPYVDYAGPDLSLSFGPAAIPPPPAAPRAPAGAPPPPRP